MIGALFLGYWALGDRKRQSYGLFLRKYQKTSVLTDVFEAEKLNKAVQQAGLLTERD